MGGYLPSRLFLRISHGQCPGCHFELGVQPCRLREQDRILPCHLEFCQEVHLRKGSRSPPSTVRSLIDLFGNRGTVLHFRKPAAVYYCGFSNTRLSLAMYMRTGVELISVNALKDSVR